jgi:hypothetical protein
MKNLLLAVLLVAAPALAQDYPGDDDYNSEMAEPPPPDAVPPEAGPTLDDFRGDSELSWNGEWIETAEYGTVWRPTRIAASWQPYLYGRWAWTNAGWAWVSEEPFGWAVYHYGRWAWTADGWVWLPGRVWGPAWVAWSWSDGYAGWCPLGPRAVVYRQPAQWVFISNQHFLEPVRTHVVPRTFPVGMTAPSGPHAGPPLHAVQQATGRTIHPLAVADAPAPHAAQPAGGTAYFYRPRTAPVNIGPRPHAQGTPGTPGAQGTPGSQGTPGKPVYFGGVPGPRYGGQPRPESTPHTESKPAPKQPQPKPHAEPHEKEK